MGNASRFKYDNAKVMTWLVPFFITKLNLFMKEYLSAIRGQKSMLRRKKLRGQYVLKHWW